MSLSVASYNDKDFYGQNLDEFDSDFFEQFVTFSPVEGTTEYETLQETEFFPNGNRSAGTSSSSLEEVKNTENDWQGDPWAFAQDAASSQKSDEANLFYSELSGRAAISDSELLSLEDISLLSPQIGAYSHPSLPSTPSPAAAASSKRKIRIVESLSNTFKRASGNIDRVLRNPIRKPIASPKMVYDSTPHTSKNKLDLWGRKLALDATKFKFDFSQEDLEIQSPPPSARVSEPLECFNADITEAVSLDDFSWCTLPPRQPASLTADYTTPLSTPILEHTPELGYRQPSGATFPKTPQLHSSASWNQVSSTPEFNSYGGSYPEAVDIESSPLWWNHAAAAPMAQPSPNTFHSNPQKATKSLAYQLQNNLAYNANDLVYSPSSMPGGLMIQMPGNPAQQPYVVASSPMLNQGYFRAAQSQPHSPYTNQHPRQRHSQYQKTPTRQPKLPHPLSKPKSRKMRSGSSESDSPSPKTSPAFHVRKQRKTHKSKRDTPRTPTLGDFVNYTPSDSRKILTGVAPSGSSKTKARREKEALEKRRKLSQAAMKAIRAAGGDVGTFVEEGLFV